MNKRPHSVTIISCLFIAGGVIGFAYHVTEFKALRPFDFSLVLVCLIRLLAILGGVFALRGRNWARWLLLAWITYHVILSVFHSFAELVTHCLIWLLVVYALFRPQASAYFSRGVRTAPTQSPSV